MKLIYFLLFLILSFDYNVAQGQVQIQIIGGYSLFNGSSNHDILKDDTIGVEESGEFPKNSLHYGGGAGVFWGTFLFRGYYLQINSGKNLSTVTKTGIGNLWTVERSLKQNIYGIDSIFYLSSRYRGLEPEDLMSKILFKKSLFLYIGLGIAIHEVEIKSKYELANPFIPNVSSDTLSSKTRTIGTPMFLGIEYMGWKHSGIGFEIGYDLVQEIKNLKAGEQFDVTDSTDPDFQAGDYIANLQSGKRFSLNLSGPFSRLYYKYEF